MMRVNDSGRVLSLHGTLLAIALLQPLVNGCRGATTAGGNKPDAGGDHGDASKPASRPSTDDEPSKPGPSPVDSETPKPSPDRDDDTTPAPKPGGGGAADSGATGPSSKPQPQPEPDASKPNDGPAPTPSGSSPTDPSDPPKLADEELLVAGGYGGLLMRSSDGVTWETAEDRAGPVEDDNFLVRGLGYGAGVWVAVGGGSKGFTATSRDGLHWQNGAREFGGWMGDVGYVNGVFLLVGGNGARFRSLDLGETWGDPAPSVDAHFRHIAAGETLAVALAESGVSYTEDGSSWSDLVTFGGGVSDVAYGNGVFVVVGGGRALVSRDGQDWSEHALAGVGDHVIFASGEFVTRGAGGFWTSKDGEEWTQNAGDSSYSPVAYFAGLFFAPASPPALFTSPSLSGWQQVWQGLGGIADMASGRPTAE